MIVIAHPLFVPTLCAVLSPAIEAGLIVAGHVPDGPVIVNNGKVCPDANVIAASVVPVVDPVVAGAVVVPVTVVEYSPFPYCPPEDIMV